MEQALTEQFDNEYEKQWPVAEARLSALTVRQASNGTGHWELIVSVSSI